MCRPQVGKSAVNSRPVIHSRPGLFDILLHHSSPATYPEEHHDDLQICVPFEGARYRVDRASATGRRVIHQLDARDILVVPQYQPHAVDWLEPAEILSLHFSTPFVEQATELSNPAIRETLVLRDASIFSTAADLRSAIREGRHTTTLLDSFATVLAYQTARHANNARLPAEDEAVPPLRSPQLARIDDFIAAHLAEPIKMSQFAELVGLSQWHFLRRFREARGVGPGAYLASCRVKQALHLLRGTNLSITEIALEVGMNSSHLARTFQLQVGTSPSAYRKMSRS